MKHLHICHNDKFTDSYIQFVNSHFDQNNHLFLILGKGIGANIKPNNNVIQSKKIVTSLIWLTKEVYSHKRIYLHGLFNPQLVLFLFFQPWLIRKCNWIIWGGDLYNDRYRIQEIMRKFVIKNMGGLITQIKGDFELAQCKYGATGKYFYSFLYPSNLYKEYDITAIQRDKERKYILVGNSADPSNNHIEILEKLSHFKDSNIEIICPLSYGDVNYASLVIEKGKTLFAHKFNPVVEFLPFDKYIEILAKVDVAIFNHNRQQAVGNIVTLLGLGKKVYIREDITTWKFCKDHELKVYSISNELNYVLIPMTKEMCESNINNTKNHFTEKRLFDDWSNIFNYEDSTGEKV